MTGPQQVPDQRLQQLMETMRRLEEQNQQLRGTINALVGKQTEPPAPPEESDFAPEIDKALNKKVDALLQKRLAAIDQEVKQRTGFVHDRTDRLEFQQKFGTEVWDKYGQKIEELRMNAERQGRWLPREEAYKHIFFEETARKPTPKPQAPKGPQFDPYLQRWQQEQAEQSVETPEAAQPPAQQATPPAPAAQPPAPAQVTKEDLGLPPVGPQTQGASVPQAQVPKDLWEADEKQMDAWADKYGDVPL